MAAADMATIIQSVYADRIANSDGGGGARVKQTNSPSYSGGGHGANKSRRK